MPIQGKIFIFLSMRLISLVSNGLVCENNDQHDRHRSLHAEKPEERRKLRFLQRASRDYYRK